MAPLCSAVVGAWLLSAVPRSWATVPADCPAGCAGEADGPSLLQLPRRSASQAAEPDSHWSQRVCFKEGAEDGDGAVLLLTGFEGDEPRDYVNIYLEMDEAGAEQRGSWAVDRDIMRKVWNQSRFVGYASAGAVDLAEPVGLEFRLSPMGDVSGFQEFFGNWGVQVNGEDVKGWDIPDEPTVVVPSPPDEAETPRRRVKCIRASGPLRADSALAISDHATTEQPADGPEFVRALSLAGAPQDGDGFEATVEGLGTNGWLTLSLGTEPATSDKAAVTFWDFGGTLFAVVKRDDYSKQYLRKPGVPALGLFRTPEEPARRSSLRVVLAGDSWQVSVNDVRQPQFDVPQNVLDGPVTVLEVAAIRARSFDIKALGQAGAPQPLPSSAALALGQAGAGPVGGP